VSADAGAGAAGGQPGTGGAGGRASGGAGGGGAGGGSQGSGGGGSGTGGAGGSPVNPAGSGCGNRQGMLMCEDFESGSLGQMWSINKKGDPTHAVDKTRPGQGAYSLHLSFSGNVPGLLKVETSTGLPAAQNKFYGRAFLYLSAILGQHAQVFRASGKLKNGDEASYGLDINGGRFNARYISPSALNQQHGGIKKGNRAAVAGKWLCIEWLFDGAGTSRFWFDGAEEPSMAVAAGEGGWAPPTFSSFEIGHQNYQDESRYEVWVDSVALGSERVGCN
jgi:hypothetical protein